MRRRPRAGSRRAALASVFPVLLLGALSGGDARPTPAQVHHLAEAPWHALDTGPRRRGVEMSWQQAIEPGVGWRSDRLGLVVLMPLGRQATAFVRADYLRFDTGDRPVFARWPQLQPADQQGSDAADSGWPHEAVINGFGRPEFGLLTPLTLPLVGRGDLGLQVGLPIGTDRLYPLSAACIPLRADWRRTVVTTGALHARLRVGSERTFSTLGDELEADAYPNGWRYALQVGSPPGRPHGWQIAWTARELEDGRHERRVSLGGWLPLPDGHLLLVQAMRSLGDRTDRHATWIFGLTWHLGSPPPDEDPADGLDRQNATADAWPDTP